MQQMGEYISTDVKDALPHFSAITDLDALTEEFGELPVHIKIYNNEISVPIRRVTKVSTICDVQCIGARNSSKECLPEIHELLKLYNAMALASATAERSFSVMRRIKSRLG